MQSWLQQILFSSQGKGVKSNPREVATKIVAEVSNSDVIEKLDVAGPGFVNIFVKKSFIEKQVNQIFAYASKLEV